LQSTSCTLTAQPSINGVPHMRVGDVMSVTWSCWDGEYLHFRLTHDWHIQTYSPPQPPISFAGLQPKSPSLTLAGERGYIPMSLNLASKFLHRHWAGIALRCTELLGRALADAGRVEPVRHRAAQAQAPVR
jgi:hypothetical protein